MSVGENLGREMKFYIIKIDINAQSLDTIKI